MSTYKVWYYGQVKATKEDFQQRTRVRFINTELRVFWETHRDSDRYVSRASNQAQERRPIFYVNDEIPVSNMPLPTSDT